MSAPVAAPRCAKCGNDGGKGALYLAVDFRWWPDKVAWETVERDDSGGGGFDCLECDHQTPAPGAESSFPYGAMISPPGAVARSPLHALGLGRKAGDVVATIADGLDVCVGGAGWGAEHQRASDLANASPALLASLRAALPFVRLCPVYTEQARQRDAVLAVAEKALAALESIDLGDGVLPVAPRDPRGDAVILAALRMWQAAGEGERAPFADIATNGGEFPRLGAAGVDQLVRRFGGGA